MLFLEPLVTYCLKAVEAEDQENRQRRLVLNRFILGVLGRPLSYLPQHPELTDQQTIPPRSHRHAASLVGMVAALTGGIYVYKLRLVRANVHWDYLPLGQFLFLHLTMDFLSNHPI